MRIATLRWTVPIQTCPFPLLHYLGNGDVKPALITVQPRDSLQSGRASQGLSNYIVPYQRPISTVFIHRRTTISNGVPRIRDRGLRSLRVWGYACAWRD